MHPISPSDSEPARIKRAMLEVVAERGFPATTAEDVSERAGVDLETFHRYYADLEQLFADLWEEFKDEFLQLTGEAFQSRRSWREGMRAAAWAFCRFLEEDPARARLYMVELNFAGERVRATRDRVMDAYVEMVDRGNEERRGPPASRERAEAVIGAIWEAVVMRIRNETLHTLPEAVPGGMFLTVLPYLGLEAAQEELRRGPQDLERYRRGEL